MNKLFGTGGKRKSIVIEIISHKQNRDIVLKTIESENFQEILPLLQVKQPQRRSKKEIIKRVLKKLCGLG